MLAPTTTPPVWHCRTCDWQGVKPIAIRISPDGLCWVCPGMHAGALHWIGDGEPVT